MYSSKVIETIEPKLILTCYDNGMITSRNVNNGIVEAAKPLYDETINKVFGHLKGYHNLKRFNGFIPENVIYADSVKEKIIWFEDAKVRKLLHTKNKNSGNFACPNLVFCLTGNSLRVFAVKQKTKQAKLYQAPFTNLTGHGVCMGSAQIKANNLVYWEDVITEVQNKFWNSLFSHDHNEYTLLGKDQKKFNNKFLKASNQGNVENLLKNEKI